MKIGGKKWERYYYKNKIRKKKLKMSNWKTEIEKCKIGKLNSKK